MTASEGPLPDKFVWHKGDVIIHRSGVISLVIDGEDRPWYRVSWFPDVDVVERLEDELTGAAPFDPSSVDADGMSLVERVMVTNVGGAGVFLTRVDPGPEGTATALHLTGAAQLELPLTDD